MLPWWGWPVLAALFVALVVVPVTIWQFVRFTRGRRLLRWVRAQRPGCVAIVVDPVPAPQPDLDRLTEGRHLRRRMVLTAEATGLELWAPDEREPIMQLAWSSVESTGMGGYSSQTEPWLAFLTGHSGGPSGTTIAFNLTGGGSIHFEAPGSRLPLDVLSDLATTREDPRESRRGIEF